MLEVNWECNETVNVMKTTLKQSRRMHVYNVLTYASANFIDNSTALADKIISWYTVNGNNSIIAWENQDHFQRDLSLFKGVEGSVGVNILISSYFWKKFL